MSNSAAIDTQLIIETDFAKSVPGNQVPDECIQEFFDRLVIMARVPDSLIDNPCISENRDNRLTQDAQGCLQVQADTFCEECQSIPAPDPAPQDVDVTFEECAAVKGIDYASQFMLTVEALPGTAYDKIYQTSLESGKVTYRIEGVTAALEVCLKAFTPDNPENAAEF